MILLDLKINHVDCLSRNHPQIVLNVINITEADCLLAAQFPDDKICINRNILLNSVGHEINNITNYMY